LCSRDDAVRDFAGILRDPTVAWEGYKASAYVGADGVWRWMVRKDCSLVASGTSPTEPDAREALAAWLLTNTMKETKQ
jgi:hypothetical protein